MSLEKEAGNKLWELLLKRGGLQAYPTLMGKGVREINPYSSKSLLGSARGLVNSPSFRFRMGSAEGVVEGYPLLRQFKRRPPLPLLPEYTVKGVRDAAQRRVDNYRQFPQLVSSTGLTAEELKRISRNSQSYTDLKSTIGSYIQEILKEFPTAANLVGKVFLNNPSGNIRGDRLFKGGRLDLLLRNIKENAETVYFSPHMNVSRSYVDKRKGLGYLIQVLSKDLPKKVRDSLVFSTDTGGQNIADRLERIKQGFRYGSMKAQLKPNYETTLQGSQIPLTAQMLEPKTGRVFINPDTEQTLTLSEFYDILQRRLGVKFSNALIPESKTSLNKTITDYSSDPMSKPTLGDAWLDIVKKRKKRKGKIEIDQPKRPSKYLTESIY
jgi:hypothetical protein